MGVIYDERHNMKFSKAPLYKTLNKKKYGR